MLSKKENKVMTAVCDALNGKNSILISPNEIIKLSAVEELSESELDKMLSDFAADGYFDLVFSDKKGEKIYCITMLEKGKGYFRSVKLFKRNIYFKIGLTVCLAILSFIIGIILKKIF